MQKKKKNSLNRRKQINRVASSILFSSSIYLLRSDKQTHTARRHASFRQKLPHPQDTSATIAVLLHIFDQINASLSSTSSPDPNFLFKSTFFFILLLQLIANSHPKTLSIFLPLPSPPPSPPAQGLSLDPTLRHTDNHFYLPNKLNPHL